jgi:hypothetical protein
MSWVRTGPSQRTSCRLAHPRAAREGSRGGWVRVPDHKRSLTCKQPISRSKTDSAVPSARASFLVSRSSIKRNGLLHPIVADKSGRLLSAKGLHHQPGLRRRSLSPLGGPPWLPREPLLSWRRTSSGRTSTGRTRCERYEDSMTLTQRSRLIGPLIRLQLHLTLRLPSSAEC